MMPASTKRAFTIVELLIVIGIIGVLAGMLLPASTLIRNMAKKSATQSLLAKVDAAVHQYRGDVGGFPYQDVPYSSWRANGRTSTSGPAATTWRNRLVYHLAAGVDPGFRKDNDTARLALRAALRADATALRTWHLTGAGAIGTADVVKDASISRLYSGQTADNNAGGDESYLLRQLYARTVNTMAAQRSALALMVGNLRVLHKPDPTATWPNVPSANLYTTSNTLTSTTSFTDPVDGSSVVLGGWRGDFLTDDLRAGKEFLVNTSGTPTTYGILDRFGMEVIYIAPIDPGVAAVTPTSPYPLGHAFASSSSVGSPMVPVEPASFRLQAVGRETLATSGSSLFADTAVAGFQRTPEIWSAGPDKLFNNTRNHSSNRDNVTATPACLDGLP